MTPKLIKRTQTRVRLESSLLKVLKAVYDCDLNASHSHKMQED